MTGRAVVAPDRGHWSLFAQVGRRSADLLGVTANVVKQSRAVDRLVEAGNSATCASCGEAIKFSAKHRLRQVICNVYEDNVWQRVEHFHATCYGEVGEPYGPAAA
jgi:hypothetical protein